MMFAQGAPRGFGFAAQHCVGGGFGMMGGPIMMFLGLALIALVIYLIYKNAHKGKGHESFSSNASDEALDVLKMKFVNGEITEEEYLRKRNLLTK